VNKTPMVGLATFGGGLAGTCRSWAVPLWLGLVKLARSWSE